jgi:hypothetical protein
MISALAAIAIKIKSRHAAVIFFTITIPYRFLARSDSAGLRSMLADTFKSRLPGTLPGWWG